jgi:hypothetical protein
MNSTNMYITLSILLKDVHKDVITLILRYFNKLDNICLILAICPNFKINKSIKGYLFQDAAKHGSLDIMKWLLANNFPYNSLVFIIAAFHGSLTNMKWLLANNFPYDKSAVLWYIKDSVLREWVYKNL